MMRKLFALIDKFRRDEDGAFLILFGVMAIMLVALSGSVVDYVIIEQTRNRAQVALDAAALSLQPSIYTDTDAELIQKAEALLNQQIANARISVVMEEISTDDDDGSLYLRARLTIPTTFIALLGFNEVKPVIISEATRKKLFLEVAMVLDNSGSMGWENRMTNLKAAAKNAVDILYEYKDPADGGDGSISDSTFISIVPFTYWVNIGAHNASAWWMDQNGLSSASWDNFDDDDDESTPFDGPLPRFDIYNNISNVSWAGCVEARPQPYDADDTEPDVNAPDTLFVPELAPDEPDNENRGRNYQNDYLDDDTASCTGGISIASCEWTQNYSGCKKNRKKCKNSSETFKLTQADGMVTTGHNVCSCNGQSYTSDTGWLNWGNGKNRSSRRTITCNVQSASANLSERERQERICKYDGSSPRWGAKGPNADCLSTQLLPLVNDRDAVIARINSMSASGSTNIHQGAIWGFHALSSTEPFTQGREYDTATYKVVILMTDGENYYNLGGGDTRNLNGMTQYTPYGWPVNRRLGNENMSADQLEGLVDGRLLQTCENMKADGVDIDVFTIGLAPIASVRTMLTNCASDPSQSYFPTSSDELGNVFEAIAQQLSDLRLAQ